MIRHLLIVFAFAGILACSTTDDSPQLNGTWIWTRTTGGIAGLDQTPESTDNIQKLEITSENITYFVNGEKTNTTPYTLEVRTSGIYQKEVPMLIFENGNQLIYALNKDTLTLTDDLVDGFMHSYTRER
ncbi:hypothetical protein [Robertkochia solimangrovi]|uniref:hypothetical protein n=1 Tax=Robertkochia solimangrovi TaxID=2213046 RepID=UPI00118053D0|nr:hypothetical protein [Robertkochia solimangrovi]TRZ41585.1 hypothetical protein DMZ48_16375 [Robertkochia solimangrovi]